MTSKPVLLGPETTDGKPAVEILSSRVAYEDFVRVTTFKIRTQRFDGSWTDPYTRNVMATGESGNAVVVLAYDPERDVVVLVEQFRMPALMRDRKSAWPLETAAGLIAHGEDPLETAKREVMEETGCTPRRMEKVGEMFSGPGAFAEVLYCYIAAVTAGNSGTTHGLAHEEENIRLHVLTVEDAVKLADSGAIEDIKTVFMLNWLARHHDSLRHRWLSDSGNEDTETGC